MSIRLVGPSHYTRYRDATPPRPIDTEQPIDGGMVAAAYGAIALIVGSVVAFAAFALWRLV